MHGHSHGSSKKDHSHQHTTQKNFNGHQNEAYSELGVDIDKAACKLNSNNDDTIELKCDIDKTNVKPSSPRLNMNIRGVFLHVMADALGSVAVLISSLMIKYIPSNDQDAFQWKFYVDPMLSILISVFIILSTIPLLKESSLILLQAIPHQININKLKNSICEIEHVLRIESFYVWSLNAENTVASLNIIVSNSTSDACENVFNKTKYILNENNITISSIQIQNDSTAARSPCYRLTEPDVLGSRQKALFSAGSNNHDGEMVIFDISKQMVI